MCRVSLSPAGDTTLMAVRYSYEAEDRDNKFWYEDGHRRETLITCARCLATSDLKLIDGALLCSWDRHDMKRWADEVLDQYPDP